MIRKRCAGIEIKMDIIGSKSFKKGYHGNTVFVFLIKNTVAFDRTLNWSVL